jgi:hypothetical protein
MKKLLTIVALFSLGAAVAATAETREDVQNRLGNAALVLHQKSWSTQNALPSFPT